MKLIVAASLNNVIGKNNQLPWKCPEDLKHFKSTTTDQIIIMGVNTFHSIGGKPLPNRINVVIDYNTEYYEPHGNLLFIRSLAEFASILGNTEDVFIIGGQKTYQDALATGRVTDIILTRINTIVEDGDRFFEVPDGWVCLARQKLSDMATVEYYKRGN